MGNWTVKGSVANFSLGTSNEALKCNSMKVKENNESKKYLY